MEWARGAVVVSTDLTAYLYWTPHPDDAKEILCLLLATISSGTLVSSAWYRTAPPREDGLAFRADTFSGRLALVRDGSGSPSADPNLIRQTSWYSISMPSR
jgi:hypothetical protein